VNRTSPRPSLPSQSDITKKQDEYEESSFFLLCLAIGITVNAKEITGKLYRQGVKTLPFSWWFHIYFLSLQPKWKVSAWQKITKKQNEYEENPFFLALFNHWYNCQCQGNNKTAGFAESQAICCPTSITSESGEESKSGVNVHRLCTQNATKQPCGILYRQCGR
jgi:hypothetical protein